MIRTEGCLMLETNGPAPSQPQCFDVHWVFGSVTEALRSELVSFWMLEGALHSRDEAWRRSWEAACVLRHATTRCIAGVCTVAIRLDEHGRSYGLVRIFIGPGNRKVGLNVRLMERMIEGFKTLASEPGAPSRLIATIENPKIERRGARQLLDRLGFASMGRTANGDLIIQRGLTA
jgi:hypothetical protein